MFFFPIEVKKLHKDVLQNGILKRYLLSHRNNRRNYCQSDTEEAANWKGGFLRPEGPLVPVLSLSPQVIVLAMHFSPAAPWVTMISYMCVCMHTDTHVYVHSNTCIYT